MDLELRLRVMKARGPVQGHTVRVFLDLGSSSRSLHVDVYCVEASVSLVNGFEYFTFKTPSGMRADNHEPGLLIYSDAKGSYATIAGGEGDTYMPLKGVRFDRENVHAAVKAISALTGSTLAGGAKPKSPKRRRIAV